MNKKQRMPFPWAFRVVDEGFSYLELAHVTQNWAAEIEAAHLIQVLLFSCGWTEQDFMVELLRHIDREWDPPPDGGGKVIPITKPFPLVRRKVTYAKLKLVANAPLEFRWIP